MLDKVCLSRHQISLVINICLGTIGKYSTNLDTDSSIDVVVNRV